MFGFVYFLSSKKKNNWIYTGSTDNLSRRIKEHISGKVKSTKGFRPLKIIYTEHFSSLAEARKREYFLKGWKGRKIKKEIIEKLGVACLRRQV